ncbi:DUF4360 domain-containing protein [Polyangium aurulentum]|uniref:DUF4360 domain-containing protein n=1 Tax=Polyangium aurulentum TaxID=2567896 RepID=UPI0010AE860A|nr:DUF4360 domain-containing protein [Polyangium aurulentum]UQA58565.1 DUF4360 domain-containing protein [Polyangium aurulentum]
MRNTTRALSTLGGAAAALSLLLVSGVAPAQEGVQIVGFTHAGGGCPAGSVGYVFDDVNNKLTLSFDQFGVKLPPGESKNCSLTFVVRVPSRLQVSLNRVEYLGYADTEPGVFGRL